MTAEPAQNPEACHTCRRRRLKCDRTLPLCLKCKKRGQECLGYGRLLRWERGVASRGKMAGVVLGEVAKPRIEVAVSLTDPVLQDLSLASRSYVDYFTKVVCSELVLYDTPQHNAFRELVPLTHRNPMLLHIVIASSALRMANASQRALLPSTPPGNLTSAASSPSHDERSFHHTRCYNDALVAKQKALCYLQSALTGNAPVNDDVVLAVVLLFVEFELIDSGRDNWIHHINGARNILDRLCGPHVLSPENNSPLRRRLISECLVFDILGSTLACPNDSSISDEVSQRTLSLLQDAEGNHCSSFPAVLLHLIQTGTRLSHPHNSLNDTDTSRSSPAQHVKSLLQIAQNFDPLAWATDLQSRSPYPDLQHRTQVASAHQAAVRIYLSRIILSLDPLSRFRHKLDSLASEAISYMACIRPKDAIFTATTWPAFIAGAETNDLGMQAWVAERFRELWDVEPWGSIRGALGVLEGIWEERRVAAETGERETAPDDWVGRLRANGVDWLII